MGAGDLGRSLLPLWLAQGPQACGALGISSLGASLGGQGGGGRPSPSPCLALPRPVQVGQETWYILTLRQHRAGGDGGAGFQSKQWRIPPRAARLRV